MIYSSQIKNLENCAFSHLREKPENPICDQFFVSQILKFANDVEHIFCAFIKSNNLLFIQLTQKRKAVHVLLNQILTKRSPREAIYKTVHKSLLGYKILYKPLGIR